MSATEATPTIDAILIPADTGIPIQNIKIPERDSLGALQARVGGLIQPIRCPLPARSEVPGVYAELYVNEDGKSLGLPINRRATDFLVPGVGLMFGDYVAGDAVLLGFDPSEGSNQDVLPGSRSRIKLIACEAGTPAL